MSTVKKRVAIFLSIMMILPTIVSILPMTATNVSAATYVSMYWSWNAYSYKTMQVEQGEEFYIGDYARVYSSGKPAVATMENASYSSSKKSVATVDSKGYFVAKNTGTTTVTIKFKGKKLTTNIKVVPKGKFKETEMISDVKAQLALIEADMPSKINVKNGFSCLKKINDYKSYIDDKGYNIDYMGVLKERKKITGSSWYSYSAQDKLAVPQAGRYLYLQGMLEAYASKNSVTSTRSAKKLQIKSVSAKTNMITLKLKKKVDTTQILAARIEGSWTELGNQNLTDNKKAYISIGISDVKGSDSYTGIAELTKGSSIVKIIPKKYSSKKFAYVKVKLKKGATYRLGSKYTWTKGKTVKVK